MRKSTVSRPNGSLTGDNGTGTPLKGREDTADEEGTKTTNFDRIRQATDALKESELNFRMFVAASTDLVYRMTADWTEMITLSGKGLLADTEQPSKNWVQIYIPEEDRSSTLASIKSAIAEKKMFELDHHVILADGSIGWVYSRAIPILDEVGGIREWLGAATDITQRKNAEEQLKNITGRLKNEVSERTAQLNQSRDMLQSIFDTTLIQMSILEAVRDEQGNIVDLTIKVVNKELERETGRKDLAGKFYSREYPGIRKTKLYGLILETIETGNATQTEYFYPFEGFNKWFSCMFVKLNDGVVATNMDITARKVAEEERFKNYTLLKQSEDLALLGNWDFDPVSQFFSWSDGMYRLFEIAPDTAVTPDIYLKYTTERGRPSAKRVVTRIREADTNFSETLEMEIGGNVKWLNVKAAIVRDDQTERTKVLGVDADVTAPRRADEKIRKMETEQQQEIFRVTLASQEEERRRISESLHNGLGQLLYGIMMSMAHITRQQALEHPQEYAKAKQYTDELVKDAIAESRRISHELMPSILEDFGLKAAITDACHQLGAETKFQCSFKGLSIKLDKYLQLAVFRTTQELMLNVVKHAGATTATTAINIRASNILIKVQDNGKGMEKPGEETDGIGLTSIRSKVKLLNGRVKIVSLPGKGTTVSVLLPNLSPQ